jgi:NADPH oxidase
VVKTHGRWAVCSNNIGLFFCGPKVLSTELHTKFNHYTTQKSRDGTKFFFNKENF